MHVNPPPSARDLLPPLLACLPTAAVSPRPPPALLPLLSPVLRQRITFLGSASSGSSDNKSWLHLLSWNPARAAKLPEVVERIDLEPHPVSGELEIEDVRPAKYQRLDEETLHARLEVEQFDLLPVYVWCDEQPRDAQGGAEEEPGWRLAELRALEDRDDDGTKWFDSPVDATNAHSAELAGRSQSASIPADRPASIRPQQEEDDDANDDYWAAYDRTPGQTPQPAGVANTGTSTSARPGVLPQSTSTAGASGRQMADAQYFARYANEVQPALDSHDPDEDHGEFGGQSTLRGDMLLSRSTQVGGAGEARDASSSSLQNGFHHNNDHSDLLSMPRPISPTSSHSSVERLEEQALAMSSEEQQRRGGDEGRSRSSVADAAAARAQLGIKMHISTDLKSLFRLARSSGMERAEFEEVVRRELEVLSLLEEED